MVPRTFRIILILWAIAIIALLYYYFAHNFTQYLDVEKSATTTAQENRDFVLSSSAFADEGVIPSQYSCDEKQISPPLSINATPAGTKSFAIIMRDLDYAPNGAPYLHWLSFDIPPDTRAIGVGEITGTQALSGNGVAGYIGPCPSRTHEPLEHRYRFDVYALDTTLGLSEGVDPATVLAAIAEHTLKQTSLLGRYARIKTSQQR